MSAWNRFEHRLNALIESIKRTSTLIDQHATSLDILQAKEWRQKSLEDATIWEKRWETQQLEAVVKWLDATNNDQQVKLEWLQEQCCSGTMHWIAQNTKFRSWM